MDILKNQIIDKIISLLSPLRSTHPTEINQITNDLINYKYDSLIEFVNNNFSSLKVSLEIKEFINKLIESKFLDESFNDKFNIITDYTFIPFRESSILLVNSKPLNVKENTLKDIISSIPKTELVPVNHEVMEVNFDKLNTNIDDISNDFDSIVNNNHQEINNNNQDTIDDLRKKILDAQLNYINNATKFIKELETKDEMELYQSLIDLNDIRFIQHSLSKLSKSALNRLLPYVEDKLENNKHSSIDMFIIEVIKKYLHTKTH